MEAEVDQQLGAEQSQRTDGRRRLPQRLSSSPSGYPNGHDVPHGAQGSSGGYIPFFVTERKRSEAMLVQVVQEAFVQGVFTRKMEKLVHSLGIENLSRS